MRYSKVFSVAIVAASLGAAPLVHAGGVALHGPCRSDGDDVGGVKGAVLLLLRHHLPYAGGRVAVPPGVDPGDRAAVQ